jgi:nucleoside-diphosphate-sugar epimerase
MPGYRNLPVLITGGLGFLGSNLAIRLVEEGARVTVVDPSIAGCGANQYNLAPVRDRVSVLAQDIAEPKSFIAAIREAQAIFNLAGEISHIHSMDFPERDLHINTVAQLRFLLECQASNPGVRVVYASTRQIYGVPDYLPVDENHPIQPVDYNGVHKYAASMYHLMLARSGAIDAISLRLTNVYGPRMALDVPCQGFLSAFLRRMLLARPLEIFGDGEQLRDPVYIDDAVEAFLIAGAIERAPSLAYNIGGPEALSLNQIARLATEAAGLDAPSHRQFPGEIKAIDIGSYHTDSSRAARELNWQPRVNFAQGIRRTLDYYRENLPHYLDPAHPDPSCRMPEHAGLERRLQYSDTR